MKVFNDYHFHHTLLLTHLFISFIFSSKSHCYSKLWLKFANIYLVHSQHLLNQFSFLFFFFFFFIIKWCLTRLPWKIFSHWNLSIILLWQNNFLTALMRYDYIYLYLICFVNIQRNMYKLFSCLGILRNTLVISVCSDRMWTYAEIFHKRHLNK